MSLFPMSDVIGGIRIEGSRFYQNDHILTRMVDAFIRSGVYSGPGLLFQEVPTGKAILKYIETDTYRLSAQLTAIDINPEL